MSTPILISAKWGGFTGISGTHCENLCWYDKQDAGNITIITREYGGCLEHTNPGFMKHPVVKAYTFPHTCSVIFLSAVNARVRGQSGSWFP
jgi:hypothetical protein